MVEAIIWSVAVLGGLGLLFGLGLGFASKKFSVAKDPRVDQVRELLPGANCGGCGYPGCDGLASALCKNEANVSSCSVVSKENRAAIAELLGVEVTDTKRRFARVLCSGGKGISADKFAYDGIRDCRTAYAVQKGPKDCSFGCLGLGTCVKVCPFGAMTVNAKGVAEVNEDICSACGQCVAACPKDCIRIVDEGMTPYMKCRNVDKGKDITKVCKAGCIGCAMCAKNCPTGAITMVDNLPVFDYEKCDGCGICIGKCPVKIIVRKEEDNA
jgi:electron transport complex protein RnfB